MSRSATPSPQEKRARAQRALSSGEFGTILSAEREGRVVTVWAPNRRLAREKAERIAGGLVDVLAWSTPWAIFQDLSGETQRRHAAAGLGTWTPGRERFRG